MKRFLLSMIVASLIVSNSTVFIQAKEKNSTKNNIQVSISKNISNEYVTRDPVYDLNDKSVNRAESEHFQIIWGNGDTTGTVTRELVEGNLQNLETIRTFYLNVMGMDDPGISQNPNFHGKYKTNLYIAATGLSKIQDDWAYMSVDQDNFGYMVMAPGALRVDPPSWVVPHEYAHVVTYHQGGTTVDGWYEAMANWFRDQYLGSEYYRFGNTVYGSESDFFAPLILNSNWYFPHQKNWYDAWPILLYITENPDGINGLGMDFMYKLLHDKGNETMFEKIERLSGQPLKEILAGYTRRMVTMDFSRQSHYLKYLDEQIKNGNYDKIYSSLEPVGDGYYKVPDDKVLMQAGYNVIPLNVDLNSKKLIVDFKSLTNDSNADFRISMVTKTRSGETRYSSIWNNGENSMKLQGDETEAYLVVCATPTVMKNYGIFEDGNNVDKYPYKVKISTSYEDDIIPTPTPTPVPDPEPTPTPDFNDNNVISLDNFRMEVNRNSVGFTNTIQDNLTFGFKGDGYYDLSKLKIRYYYRASDYNAENIWIDTAAGMFTTDPWYLNILTNVKTKFVNMDHYEGNNNSYVEFSFDTAFMVDSSATFKINFRLAKKDWSNFYIDPNSNEANNIVVYYEK